MSEDIYIGTDGEIKANEIHPQKKFNVELDVSNNTNVQESGRIITDIVQQNPDILITHPIVQRDKIRFVVASGSKTIEVEEVKRRVEDFGKMFTLPFTLGQVKVTNYAKKDPDQHETSVSNPPDEDSSAWV